ncbi:MAG TPA: AraC family transcriptional regulator [Bryobacteraceae bacterium]|nr:AraC family transcriptional regulator [Bryobacteraceae bacterium]
MDASGQTLRLRTIGPFTVNEQLYPNGLVIPRHSHNLDYITFVLEGTFRERYGAHSIFCRTGAVRFLPAGVAHENEIAAGLRCLHIAAEPATLDQLRQDPTIPRRPAEISGLTATWLANRLYMEFSRQDTASEMAIQGLVLELLAEIARSEAADPALVAPHWLQQAVEIVESRFLERLSLSEIAAEVGVHYVHLSRQFHKYNRCTVGELIRRRRVQYASHLLAHSNTPLAEIALICGFSDQSHLSFLFKRYMGMSPSKFRSLAGTNSVGVTTMDFSPRVRAVPLRAASGE